MKVVYLFVPGASHQSPGCLYFCVRPFFVPQSDRYILPGTAGGVITWLVICFFWCKLRSYITLQTPVAASTWTLKMWMHVQRHAILRRITDH
jgi:hypothetical protein